MFWGDAKSLANFQIWKQSGQNGRDFLQIAATRNFEQLQMIFIAEAPLRFHWLTFRWKNIKFFDASMKGQTNLVALLFCAWLRIGEKSSGEPWNRRIFRWFSWRTKDTPMIGSFYFARKWKVCFALFSAGASYLEYSRKAKPHGVGNFGY